MDGVRSDIQEKAKLVVNFRATGSEVGLWSCGWNDSESLPNGCKTILYPITGRQFWNVVWGAKPPQSVMERLH
jgi:hypothetical protein